MAPNGDVAVDSEGGGVLALRDTDEDGKPDETEMFGSDPGHGIAFQACASEPEAERLSCMEVGILTTSVVYSEQLAQPESLPDTTGVELPDTTQGEPADTGRVARDVAVMALPRGRDAVCARGSHLRRRPGCCVSKGQPFILAHALLSYRCDDEPRLDVEPSLSRRGHMSESNSSVVSIVAIVAILIMVGLAIYFFMFRSSNDASLEIDITGAMSEMVPDPEHPMPAGLAFVSLPG